MKQTVSFAVAQTRENQELKSSLWLSQPGLGLAGADTEAFLG